MFSSLLSSVADPERGGGGGDAAEKKKDHISAEIWSRMRHLRPQMSKCSVGACSH